MLLENYSDENKLDELLALGDISSLRENVYPDPTLPHDFENSQENVTIAYHRDRGEEIHKASIISLDDAKNSWCDYMYIFGRDGKWRYYILLDDEPELRDLETNLNAEHKKMGIKRPQNFYGWFSDAELEQIRIEQTQIQKTDMVM